MYEYRPKEENGIKEHKPIKDLSIDRDSFLLALFKKKIEEVRFIKEETRIAIMQLRDVELHLQTDQLVGIWKNLIGNAIVFLKTKDEREKYHDEMTLGTKKLYKFLEEFQDFETMLYGAVPNYRDHIAHVFRVFCWDTVLSKLLLDLRTYNRILKD